MSVIGITGTLLAVIIWHEFGHFIAADQLKAAEDVCLIRSKHWLGKWFLIGPAISVDDDKISDRQLWGVILAPLLWSIPGAAFLLLYALFPHVAFIAQGVVWLGAAAFVVISDIPQYLTLGVEDDGYDKYVLLDFEGRYE